MEASINEIQPKDIPAEIRTQIYINKNQKIVSFEENGTKKIFLVEKSKDGKWTIKNELEKKNGNGWVVREGEITGFSVSEEKDGTLVIRKDGNKKPIETTLVLDGAWQYLEKMGDATKQEIIYKFYQKAMANGEMDRDEFEELVLKLGIDVNGDGRPDIVDLGGDGKVDGIDMDHDGKIDYTLAAAYNFFSTGGWVGVEGDKGITAADLEATFSRQINKVAKALGKGENEMVAIVQEYLTADKYVLIDVKKIKDGLVEELGSEDKLTANGVMGLIKDTDTKKTASTLFVNLGVSKESDGTLTDKKLDDTTLEAFLLGMAFLAQLPKEAFAQGKPFAEYGVDTSKLQKPSLLSKADNYLAWLEGEEVIEEEEGSGGTITRTDKAITEIQKESDPQKLLALYRRFLPKIKKDPSVVRELYQKLLSDNFRDKALEIVTKMDQGLQRDEFLEYIAKDYLRLVSSDPAKLDKAKEAIAKMREGDDKAQLFAQLILKALNLGSDKAQDYVNNFKALTIDENARFPINDQTSIGKTEFISYVEAELEKPAEARKINSKWHQRGERGGEIPNLQGKTLQDLDGDVTILNSLISSASDNSPQKAYLYYVRGKLKAIKAAQAKAGEWSLKPENTNQLFEEALKDYQLAVVQYEKAGDKYSLQKQEVHQAMAEIFGQALKEYADYKTSSNDNLKKKAEGHKKVLEAWMKNYAPQSSAAKVPFGSGGEGTEFTQLKLNDLVAKIDKQAKEESLREERIEKEEKRNEKIKKEEEKEKKEQIEEESENLKTLKNNLLQINNPQSKPLVVLANANSLKNNFAILSKEEKEKIKPEIEAAIKALDGRPDKGDDSIKSAIEALQGLK